MYVALFLTSMIQESESFNKANQVYYSLKFLHDVFGSKNSCKSSLVKLVLESAKRKLSKPVQKKGSYQTDSLEESNYYVDKGW